MDLVEKRRELEVMKSYLATDDRKKDEEMENRKR
jgi:hypothetical protein